MSGGVSGTEMPAWSLDYGGTFTDEHAKIINKFFELSKEIGMINSYPDINSVVWERALRA